MPEPLFGKKKKGVGGEEEEKEERGLHRYAADRCR
jgi:hypothetical protein